MTFGNRLKKIRIECDLTQKELGELVGLKQTTIARYERDAIDPVLSMCHKMAGALGVSARWLIGF